MPAPTLPGLRVRCWAPPLARVGERLVLRLSVTQPFDSNTAVRESNAWLEWWARPQPACWLLLSPPEGRLRLSSTSEQGEREATLEVHCVAVRAGEMAVPQLAVRGEGEDWVWPERLPTVRVLP